MTKRMLIDASHKEETRVAIVGENNTLEEIDFETTTKATIKGNVYLAKVMRVEPSLQAAFVDYGGNRHGFLAFNEIHPDYFRIPVSDRAKIMEEVKNPALVEDQPIEDVSAGENQHLSSSVESSNIEEVEDDKLDEVTSINSEGYEGETDDVRVNLALHKRYKIQEVIQKGQIMLIQVVKEERGNKGAAMTTYLSLAGRYCVLMPNALRGGGVSRRITNAEDRKRLRTILEEAELPEGIRAIIRTAGMQRTKIEIRKDLDYLTTLWNEIRETTLKANAPSLIHEEAHLIKRALRDLYERDTEEVLVEGKEGYKTAKNFMKAIMPSHSKKVKEYKDTASVPLFHAYDVEDQITQMHTPIAPLKSGGSIVINPTEALVSIDVNSGRSTRERHIEETAYLTNLEAAEEVARQLRLRDLAGLVVVDFIDMDDQKNIINVEKRLKECMKSDRARIQVGRISSFGLLELSRQRLRPSILESSSAPCSYCNGTGHTRSVESGALFVLRSLEKLAIEGKFKEFKVSTPVELALYIFNEKRATLAHLEEKFNVSIRINHDATLHNADFKIMNEDDDLLVDKAETKAIPLAAGDEKFDRRKSRKQPPKSPKQEDSSQDRPSNRRNRKRRKDQEPVEITESVAVQEEQASPSSEGDLDRPKKEGGRRRNRNRNRRRGGSKPSQNAPSGQPAQSQTQGEKPSSGQTNVTPLHPESPKPDSSKKEGGGGPKRKGWWQNLFD